MSLNGTSLSILSSGNVQIKASQSGNDNYLPAQVVYRHFTIKPVITLNSVRLDTDNYDLLLDFEANGIVRNEHILIQLSDAEGSFENPQYFYSTIDVKAGKASVQIPANIKTSNSYRIRIIGSPIEAVSNTLGLEALYRKPRTSWVHPTGNSVVCASANGICEMK